MHEKRLAVERGMHGGIGEQAPDATIAPNLDWAQSGSDNSRTAIFGVKCRVQPVHHTGTRAAMF